MAVKDKRGPIAPEIEGARRALRSFQKATQALFIRAAEDSSRMAEKALDEIAIELADDGTLEYFVNSIDAIAKANEYKSWEHLLVNSGEFSGLKETLKQCKRERAAKAGR